MVTWSPNEARRRQTTIEAACRVAMRMFKTDRGSAAALQFLVDVAARHCALSAAIVGKGDIGIEPLFVCSGEPGGVEAYWSIPIRTGQGPALGELRVRAPARQDLDVASMNALEAVARTAAKIMAQAEGLRPGDQSP